MYWLSGTCHFLRPDFRVGPIYLSRGRFALFPYQVGEGASRLILNNSLRLPGEDQKVPSINSRIFSALYLIRTRALKRTGFFET